MITIGVHITPLTLPSADGRPIPVTGQCMEHDKYKGAGNEYCPSGGPIHAVAEGMIHSPAKENQHHNYCGSNGFNNRALAGHQEMNWPPPPPPPLIQDLHQNSRAYQLPEAPDPPQTPNNMTVAPVNQWGKYLWSPLRICNVTRTAYLPDIRGELHNNFPGLSGFGFHRKLIPTKTQQSIDKENEHNGRTV